MSTEWDYEVYDCWGNEDDGYDINDILIATTVKFEGDAPSDAEVYTALNLAWPTYSLEWVDNDHCEIAKGTKPVGRLMLASGDGQ